MTGFTKISSFGLLLAAIGCSTGVTPEDAPPPPDLPCEGADLRTDDANCGVCGNGCVINHADSPYSSGHCVDGECGPTIFHQCFLLAEGTTCAEICAADNGTCVARGCPGVHNEQVSGVLFAGMAGPCLPDAPAEELLQDCDEPIAFDPENYWLAQCCCR